MKALLSDICGMQGVKRVICPLIENRRVARDRNAKTYFPFPIADSLSATVGARRTTGPITAGSLLSTSVPLTPCLSVTCHAFSSDAISHNSVISLLSRFGLGSRPEAVFSIQINASVYCSLTNGYLLNERPDRPNIPAISPWFAGYRI